MLNKEMMLIELSKLIQNFNLQINGVIHVGAHVGQEYPTYKKHGINHVVWFEPVLSTYKKLVENLPEGSITYNIALGNEEGTKEMFIETVNGGQSSSLLEPGTHLETYPDITFDSKQKVQMLRLDSFAFPDTLNMINMDVQGYELDVLKGSVNTLEHIDIIYTEINTEDVYKNCVHVDQLDTFLNSKGFERVFTQMACKSWGDALYLRTKNHERN
jgi:FkbM family methyltransferase